MHTSRYIYIFLSTHIFTIQTLIHYYSSDSDSSSYWCLDLTGLVVFVFSRVKVGYSSEPNSVFVKAHRWQEDLTASPTRRVSVD